MEMIPCIKMPTKKNSIYVLKRRLVWRSVHPAMLVKMQLSHFLCANRLLCHNVKKMNDDYLRHTNHLNFRYYA